MLCYVLVLGRLCLLTECFFRRPVPVSSCMIVALCFEGTHCTRRMLGRKIPTSPGFHVGVSNKCIMTGNHAHTTKSSAPPARQILELVGSKPSLSRISLIGNSLGGLYVRYAAKLLYSNGDDAGGADGGAMIAGLQPSVFMTIACPHLGVRRFTYVPLPSMLHPLAEVLVGKTGADLFLSRKSASGTTTAAAAANNDGSSGDNNGAEHDTATGGGGARAREGTGSARDGRESVLLYSMCTSEEFLRPLKAFRWRRAYANRRGDFMVPYGTAAFLEPTERDRSEEPVSEGVMEARGPSAPAAGADAGTGGAAAGGSTAGSVPAVLVGTGSFSLADRLLGAKNGAIVGFWRAGPAAPGRAAVVSGGQGELAQHGGRTGFSATTQSSAAKEAGRNKDSERKSMEEEMAAGLNSCGWEKASHVF